MRRVLLLPMTGLLLALLSLPAHAQTPSCAELDGYQKAMAEELLASQRPYDCCDDTIANCLEQEPTCSLAFRLSENICRRVAERQPRARILEALEKRERNHLSMKKRIEIDLTGLSAAGDASAPITLVAYACPRCFYCARITPKIYDAVVKGPLRGKAKLYFKTFPLPGHMGAKESGLAFVAAEKLGHFWEFVLYFFERFELFSVARQLEWAEAVGMDLQVFQRVMDDPATRQSLVKMRKEGIVNEIRATPTFFVDGERYSAELSHQEVVDVLEEKIEKLEGILYRR